MVLSLCRESYEVDLTAVGNRQPRLRELNMILLVVRPTEYRVFIIIIISVCTESIRLRFPTEYNILYSILCIIHK